MKIVSPVTIILILFVTCIGCETEADRERNRKMQEYETQQYLRRLEEKDRREQLVQHIQQEAAPEQNVHISQNVEPKPDSRPLEAFISCEIDKNEKGQVRGMIKTNLPDKTKIGISVRSGTFIAQDSQEIRDGVATSNWFSNRGNPLREGEYEMEITVPIVEVQPKEVQHILGKDYSNVTGSAFIKDPFWKSMKFVETFSIGTGTPR